MPFFIVPQNQKNLQNNLFEIHKSHRTSIFLSEQDIYYGPVNDMNHHSIASSEACRNCHNYGYFTTVGGVLGIVFN